MFDVAGARSAGYSDDEIVQHISRSGKAGFDFAGAAKAGYTSSQMLDAIAQRSGGGVDLGTRTADGTGIVGVGPISEQQDGQDSGKRAPADTNLTSAPVAGAGRYIAGVGKTLKHYTPFTSAGEKLESVGDGITPQNYQSARIVDENGNVHLGEAPRAVAEAAPGMAAGLTAARLLSRLPKVGPVIGALAGAGGSYAVSQMGQRAEDRATVAGEDPSNPSGTSKTVAALSTAAGVPLEALGARGFIPGKVASRGALAAGGRLLKKSAVEGATEGADSLVEQTGRTLGTEGGLRIDPTEAANAAATGVAAGGAFGATRAAREAEASRRFRKVDETVAPEVANDISRNANGDLGVRGGFTAIRRTEQDYKTDLAASIRDFRKETGAQVDGVLKRAAAGELDDGDVSSLEQRANGTVSGPAVVQLAKKLTALTRVKAAGSYDTGSEKFKGGVGNRMEKALWFLSNPAKAGLYTGGALATGSAFNPGMMIHSLPIMGGLTAAYGGARVLDRALNTRSPAKAFVEQFGGQPSVGPQTNQPPQQPQAPAAPGPQPTNTGPQGPWGPIPTNAYPTRVPNVAQPNTLPAVIPQPPQGAPGVINAGAPAPMLELPAPRPGPSSSFPRAEGAVINQPQADVPQLPAPTAIQQPGPALRLSLPAPRAAQLPDVRRRDPLSLDGVDRAVVRTMDAAADAERSDLANPVGPRSMTPEQIKAGAAALMRTRRKPIVNDGEPAPLPKLTVVEEGNEQAVLEALRAGKNTFGEIRVHADIDAQDLKATLNRMKVEGKINLDGAGVSEVGQEKPKPTKARTLARVAAKTKPKVKKEEPAVAEAVQTPEPDKAPSIVPEKPRAPVPAAKPKPSSDEDDIPSFLRLSPEERAAGRATTKEAATVKEAIAPVVEGSPASEHFVPKDREKTVSNILANFAKEKGLKSADAIFPKIRDGITRKINEKHDTMEAIAKEVPGFAVATHTSQYVKAMSIAGGERLRAELKSKYPGHDDVFDKLLADNVLSGMFSRKKSKLDGTRK